MLYVDYKFTINESGLKMEDTHPDEMITIEKSGLKLGDIFVLSQTSNGALFFRKAGKQYLTPNGQLELEF